MPQHSRKRKSAAPLIILLCFALATTGCGPEIVVPEVAASAVSADELLSAGNLLVGTLSLLFKIADSLRQSRDENVRVLAASNHGDLVPHESATNTAYAPNVVNGDLAQSLIQNGLSSPLLGDMERRHFEMENQASACARQLQVTQQQAGRYFGLLNRRAAQHTDAAKRAELQSSISMLQQEFAQNLDLVKQALDRTSADIARYNNLIVEAEVSLGKNRITQSTNEVKRTAEEVAALDSSVRAATQSAIAELERPHSDEAELIRTAIDRDMAIAQQSGSSQSVQHPSSILNQDEKSAQIAELDNTDAAESQIDSKQLGLGALPPATIVNPPVADAPTQPNYPAQWYYKGVSPQQPAVADVRAYGGYPPAFVTPRMRGVSPSRSAYYGSYRH